MHPRPFVFSHFGIVYFGCVSAKLWEYLYLLSGFQYVRCLQYLSDFRIENNVCIILDLDFEFDMQIGGNACRLDSRVIPVCLDVDYDWNTDGSNILSK